MLTFPLSPHAREYYYYTDLSQTNAATAVTPRHAQSPQGIEETAYRVLEVAHIQLHQQTRRLQEEHSALRVHFDYVYAQLQQSSCELDKNQKQCKLLAEHIEKTDKAIKNYCDKEGQHQETLKSLQKRVEVIISAQSAYDRALQGLRTENERLKEENKQLLARSGEGYRRRNTYVPLKPRHVL